MRVYLRVRSGARRAQPCELWVGLKVQRLTAARADPT